MKIFKDRKAAGQLLVQRLKGVKADLVLGIPRGGVVVASEIAKKLKLPLDIIVTRKIGAPQQPELALGAIDPDGEVVLDESLIRQFQITNIKNQISNEWKELKRREYLYRNGRPQPKLEGKTVILVDDGMATGQTTLAACKYLRRHGAKTILAVPVASQDALQKVSSELESTVVLYTPEDFSAVGQFYHEFKPVTDEEVVKLLS